MAHSPFMPYDAYTVSPVHRLFQMWQELDCSADGRDRGQSVGLPFTISSRGSSRTIAAGSNGKAQPAGYIGEGSTSPLFFNNAGRRCALSEVAR